MRIYYPEAKTTLLNYINLAIIYFSLSEKKNQNLLESRATLTSPLVLKALKLALMPLRLI